MIELNQKLLADDGKAAIKAAKDIWVSLQIELNSAKLDLTHFNLVHPQPNTSEDIRRKGMLEAKVSWLEIQCEFIKDCMKAAVAERHNTRDRARGKALINGKYVLTKRKRYEDAYALYCSL